MDIGNRNNSLFSSGPSLLSRFTLVALISIILMVVDHRMHHLETLRSSLSVLIYPVQYLAQMPLKVWKWGGESLADRDQLLNENQQLRDQHILIKARLQRLEALESENERLRSLLNSSDHLKDRILVAELIAVDLDPYKHQIVINKGSRDGAYIGQPILDANGVMGQLTHVGPISATAMLITDPGHAIPVQFNRTGIRTTAVGSGDLHRLDIPYLPSNSDVQVNDLLVTSGLGGRFPAGYPVAIIRSIDSNPTGSFARISATPLAELDRSREALLVWSGLSTDEMEIEPAAQGKPEQNGGTNETHR